MIFLKQIWDALWDAIAKLFPEPDKEEEKRLAEERLALEEEKAALEEQKLGQQEDVEDQEQFSERDEERIPEEPLIPVVRERGKPVPI